MARGQRSRRKRNNTRDPRMPGVSDLFRGGGTPRLTRRWKADLADHVIRLAWSPSGKSLAAASVSGPVTLFEPAAGKVEQTLTGHGFGTTCVAWRRDGALLA